MISVPVLPGPKVTRQQRRALERQLTKKKESAEKAWATANRHPTKGGPK